MCKVQMSKSLTLHDRKIKTKTPQTTLEITIINNGEFYDGKY